MPIDSRALYPFSLAIFLLVQPLLASARVMEKRNACAEALLELRSDDAIRALATPLNQALETQDKKLAALIMRLIAIAFRHDDNHKAACQSVLTALKLNPDDIYCHFQAAEYLFRDGHWQESEEIYEELKKNKNPLIALRAGAFLSLQKGLVHDAKGSLEKYLAKMPDDKRALMNLSYIYLILEEEEKAAEVQKKLAGLCKTPYLKEIYIARAAASKKDFENAELHYKKAGEYQPDDPLWHSDLALMQMKLQKVKEADREFRQSFLCRRLISKAYTHWAVMQSFFGSKKDADSCLDYVLRLRPGGSEVFFVKGIIETQKNEPGKAKAAFESAIALNPYNSGPYLHLLQMADSSFSKEDKLKLCIKWQKACHRSGIAAIELAKQYERAGREKEALEAYLKARDLQKGRKVPEDNNLRIRICQMHASLAVYYYKQNNFGKALEEAIIFNKLKPQEASNAGLSTRLPQIELEKINDKEKHEAAEHALVADTLLECGRLDLAEKEYRLAEKKDPQNMTYHSCLLKVLLDKKDFAAAAAEDAAVSQHLLKKIGSIFAREHK